MFMSPLCLTRPPAAAAAAGWPRAPTIHCAGVVLSAACVAAGRAMSPSSLVHAVLRVEQLMTAGASMRVASPTGGCGVCFSLDCFPGLVAVGWTAGPTELNHNISTPSTFG